MPYLTTVGRNKYQWESLWHYYRPAYLACKNRKSKRKIMSELIKEGIKRKCLPYHYFRYGLFEEGTDRERYIPDTVFYEKILPVNNSDHILLDDKIIFEQLCRANSLPIPEMHCYFKHGRFFFADGIEVETEECISYLNNLETDKLILKHANFWHGGQGVFVFNRVGNEFVSDVFGKLDESLLKGSRNDWIIQAFCENHDDISHVFWNSFNTLRVLSQATESGPNILGAVMKFWVGENQTDNATWWWVYAVVKKDGTLERVAYDQNLKTYTHHPDTWVEFASVKVPQFDQVQEVITRTSEVFDKTRVVWWDIWVTNDGPVIIEGNSSPGIALIQRPSRWFDKDVLLKLLAKPWRAV